MPCVGITKVTFLPNPLPSNATYRSVVVGFPIPFIMEAVILSTILIHPAVDTKCALVTDVKSMSATDFSVRERE